VQEPQSDVETPTVVSRAAVVGTMAPDDCASRARNDVINPASAESLIWSDVELETLSDVIKAATTTPPMIKLKVRAMMSSISVNPWSASGRAFGTGRAFID
jgi:hypothetical protein